ncbi:MAG: ribonuclease III [Cyanobacteria bacterium Co-bin8]|nr:ribonuclease III [Cyanobacteria bacterium Co-bin8]
MSKGSSDASEDAEKVGLSLQVLVRLRDILLEPGSPMSLSNGQVQALSPIALAYIGDAVYELFVRGFFLTPPCRIQAYHQKVVSQVRAEQQSHQLSKLTPYLTADEQDILRKGRNASPRGPRRIDPQIYQQATGFEALIGYLYLTDPRRLTELFSYVDLTLTDSL